MLKGVIFGKLVLASETYLIRWGIEYHRNTFVTISAILMERVHICDDTFTITTFDEPDQREAGDSQHRFEEASRSSSRMISTHLVVAL